MTTTTIAPGADATLLAVPGLRAPGNRFPVDDPPHAVLHIDQSLGPLRFEGTRGEAG